MQNRFKMIPGMKRDLRLIGALGTKMLRNVFATVPTESLIAGCQDHCMMCGLDRETERKCTLKKALDNTGSDVSHDGGCGYRSVVG